MTLGGRTSLKLQASGWSPMQTLQKQRAAGARVTSPGQRLSHFSRLVYSRTLVLAGNTLLGRVMSTDVTPLKPTCDALQPLSPSPHHNNFTQSSRSIRIITVFSVYKNKIAEQ